MSVKKSTKKNYAPDAWFHNAIMDGLTILMALRLENTPGEETITITAQAWVRSLWATPTDWNEKLDTPRITEAFTQMMGALEKWPAPKTLLGYLPERKKPLALELRDIRSPEQKKADMQRLINLLKGGFKQVDA